MKHADRVIASFLAMLTGIWWEPRYDPQGRVYMWLRPKDGGR